MSWHYCNVRNKREFKSAYLAVEDWLQQGFTVDVYLAASDTSNISPAPAEVSQLLNDLANASRAIRQAVNRFDVHQKDGDKPPYTTTDMMIERLFQIEGMLEGVKALAVREACK